MAVEEKEGTLLVIPYPIPRGDFSVHRLFAPSLQSKRLDRRNTLTVQGRSQDFSKGESQRLLSRLSCRPPRAHSSPLGRPDTQARLSCTIAV